MASKSPGPPRSPGCPKGSRNKATVLLERMLADDGAAVVAAVLEKAKSGDMTAARLVLDRLVPPRKERPIEIDLPS